MPCLTQEREEGKKREKTNYDYIPLQAAGPGASFFGNLADTFFNLADDLWKGNEPSRKYIAYYTTK
jgi:hypothetical protein